MGSCRPWATRAFVDAISRASSPTTRSSSGRTGCGTSRRRSVPRPQRPRLGHQPSRILREARHAAENIFLDIGLVRYEARASATKGGRLAMIRPSCPVRRFARSVLVVVLGVSVFAREGGAEIFADIPGIPGESTAAVAPDQIELQSLSLGSGHTSYAIAKQKQSEACGGKTSPQICQVVMTKGVDKASPKLFMAAAAGTRFPTVTFAFFKNDPSGLTQYLKVTLANALVDSMSSSGLSNGTPTESVSLSCSSMETTYTKVGDNKPPQTETATATFCAQ